MSCRRPRPLYARRGPSHRLFPDEVGIRRFGKLEEIADLMAYLVSPAAKWMTGASIRMDGGEIKGI